MAEQNFFTDGSPYLTHPLLTLERTRRECDEITNVLALPPGASILDAGCGFGRHCVELALRGFQVVGVDPAPAMIEAARRAAGSADVSPRFVIGIVQSLPVGESFDAAICMFTTLGQVDHNGEDNVGILADIYGRLRPGGQLVVEVPQRDAYLRAMSPDDQLGETHVTRNFDAVTMRVDERFVLGVGSTQRVFDLSYRLFDAGELASLLTRAGFDDVVISTSLREQTLDPDSPTMVARATR